MRVFYLGILLCIFAGLFFLPGLIGQYKNGDLVGTEAQGILDSLNPLAELSPATGSGDHGIQNKYLPSAGRFERMTFSASETAPNHASSLDFFLYAPPKPWPEDLKFPLVIHLHDKRTAAYSAEYVTQDGMSLAFPAFSVVPLLGDIYGENVDTTMGKNTLVHTSAYMGKRKSASDVTMEEIKAYHKDSMHLSQSVVPAITELTRHILDHYPIDENRVYIVGCGYGSLTLFGSLVSAPDLYAGALAVSGSWQLRDAQTLTSVPLYMVNGGDNRKFPAFSSRAFAKNIKAAGGDVRYKQFNSMGHTCSYSKFYSPEIWEWVFSHKK